MNKENITIGLIAHVDAGKTTLAESLLYHGGTIRNTGRVDHGDSFLDTDQMERARGIAIFSKQAIIETRQKIFTILDTPGHADLVAETERVMEVLDYAIMIISGADGVQSHTETLWRLLRAYNVPVFVFINKMDREGVDRDAVMAQLAERLGNNFVDFSDRSDLDEEPDLQEEIAMCHEDLLNIYASANGLCIGDVIKGIRKRMVFPCFFGSALKDQGVRAFLDVVDKYTGAGYPQAKDVADATMSAKIFKITRDGNTRLAHMKITSGVLKVKDTIDRYEEKAEEIRIYNGSGYERISEAGVGTVCAVVGLPSATAGDGIGSEEDITEPVLEAMFDHVVTFGDDDSAPEQSRSLDARMYSKIKVLEEEDPQLRITWNETYGQIHMQLMGTIQTQIMTRIIEERFGLIPHFGQGQVLYKETITGVVEGVGHYEPLRHYAEVHLIMETSERGSGLIFDTDVHPDELALNWQNLIITHLGEIRHRGALTGSEITDMKITLVGGRSHLKHTEPGDFREATYRAVRHGLMKSASRGEAVLLEPVYEFTLEIPMDMSGRAMADIQRMHGSFAPVDIRGERAILRGRAPATELNGYGETVMSYTHGSGMLNYALVGYEPCHDAERVVAEMAYEPDADLDHPSGSIFCYHGSGEYVPWNEVEDHMHISARLKHSGAIHALSTSADDDRNVTTDNQRQVRRGASAARVYESGRALDRELDRIFRRTYGDQEKTKTKNRAGEPVTREFTPVKIQNKPARPELIIVDGYNMIFNWPELLGTEQTDQHSDAGGRDASIDSADLDAARERLIDMMANYSASAQRTLILVFDGYKVKGNPGTAEELKGITVVYTREHEKADQYIERAVSEMSREYDISVATSDYMEQIVVFSHGARRVTAAEFRNIVAGEAGRSADIAAGKSGIISDSRLKASLEELFGASGNSNDKQEHE